MLLNKIIPIATYLFISSICGNVSASNFNLKNSENYLTSDYYAQTDSSDMKYDFPQINIIGNKPALFNTIPGSANIINNSTLRISKAISGNEVFKKIPGLNVVDEEGVGLRANIGIRGLDPDRSRTVLMMEDGIPIALAPYGEPEMYYTPAIDRMSKIEILKGSGSILFGPQTIGGVINYITADPPIDAKSTMNLRFGGSGFFSGQLAYGTTVGNIGLQTTILHKKVNELGNLNYNINDLTAKIKFGLGEDSRVGLKLGFYDEISNSTYLGLTQSMYDNEEYYTIMAPYDNLKIKRYSASLTHDYFISSNAFLRTSIYGYTTSRNWLRQDFSRSANTTNKTGIVFGDSTVPNGAVYMKNSTGNRDRQFEVFGIEPRLNYSYYLGEIANEFDGGIRFHFEKAYEQRINGKKASAHSGDLVDDEERIGYAGSAFLQNRVFLNDQISFTPGFRLEYFNFERRINRISSKDTTLSARSDVFSLIPGIGVNFNFSQNYTLFAGLHRGFAPPRVKDAISNSGNSLQLEAEHSWNSEIGIRANPFYNVWFELTGYILDFSNQIIPVSESSGGSGTGLVNGGRTLHKGIEIGLNFDLGKVLNSDYEILLNWNASINESKYNADRFINLSNSPVNIKGNELPYAPKYLSSFSVNVQTPYTFEFYFSGTYVGKQFTDELNTVIPSADGQSGLMSSYIVLDFNAKYHLESLNSSIFISVKNLTDERYIASRRPQGIKVGIPRLITGGIELSF
jgi:Fe(3+) dicitrate transport protein